MIIHKPYLLFLGDAHDDLAAKTAIGVWQWRPDECVGQLRLPGCVPKLPIDEIDLEEGRRRGARPPSPAASPRRTTPPRRRTTRSSASASFRATPAARAPTVRSPAATTSR